MSGRQYSPTVRFRSNTRRAQVFVFVAIHALGAVPIVAPFDYYAIFLVLISGTFWGWDNFWERL